jgi:FKBP-type peptidyl-prolyl cis-trans isomerase (trigger factor)
MKFRLTIPTADVKKAYKDVTTKAAKDIKIKGFRKGKAPLKLAAEQIGASKLRQAVIELLLPPAYVKEIKKRKLKPISSPKITANSLINNHDWEFEIEIAEMPPVKLGQYQQEIKAALAKVEPRSNSNNLKSRIVLPKSSSSAGEKIWTPQKGKPKSTDDPKDTSNDRKKLDLVIQTLLKTCQVDVPELLIDQEVNRLLSRLLNQVDKLGLTIDSYLKSTNKTREQIRDQYRQQARQSLKLELILQAVADDLKIKVSDQEIETMIDSVKDEAERQKFQDPAEKAALKLVLKKQQTVFLLMNLA